MVFHFKSSIVLH